MGDKTVGTSNVGASRTEMHDCPLVAVDRRLQDAHTLWHQAEEKYFEPHTFLLAVQNTIQTLRTVTWILQKHKAKIPDFEAWYGPWQDQMAADALLRWIRDARNKIEKQGDLEAQSIVRADIIASFLNEGPSVEVPAALFDTPSVILRKIPSGPVGEHILRHGTLRIERRWVENSLPEYELLDALAIAYGRLAEIVADAHRRIGIQPPVTVRDGTNEQFDPAAMNWRMPCMIGHEERRSLLISLSDGSRLKFDTKTISVDPEEAANTIARYGVDPRQVLQKDYENEEKWASALFELARNVFLRDGHHRPFMFLLHNRKRVAMFDTTVTNQREKYLLMRRLAKEVVKCGADAVATIDEAWIAPASELAPYQRPSESPSRREALVLTLCTKKGDPTHFQAMIERSGSVTSLGDTTIEHGGAQFTFAPIYEAWGRSIPESWLAAGQAIENASHEEWRAHVDAERQRTFKVGRNDPCPCGSGKKYKKCCGAFR